MSIHMAWRDAFQSPSNVKRNRSDCITPQPVVSFCMEIEASFVCAYCFQINELVVDASGGEHQEYIEDCQVCCRPNDLHVSIDVEEQTAEILAEVS